MSLQHNLILQPNHNSTTDILKAFTLGIPLTCDQINYVAWHQKQLSSPQFDLIYKYYIDAAKKKNTAEASFLLSSKEFTLESVNQLKKRVNLVLQNNSTHFELHLTPHQFLQFRALTTNELIFWHGNQLLHGASFFPGGIPPVLYFRWGNLFGVLLYVFTASPQELNSKALLHFENRLDRSLDQCVEDYQKTMKNELKLQNTMLHENKLDLAPLEHFIIRPPTFMPSPSPYRK